MFFFTPNLRNNGGNPSHNTFMVGESWTDKLSYYVLLVREFWMEVQSVFWNQWIMKPAQQKPAFQSTCTEWTAAKRLNRQWILCKKKTVGFADLVCGHQMKRKPALQTYIKNFVCCNEISQTGLAQFLCFFPCIYVFQVWRKVMCIVLQTKWSELIEPTSTPSMAHWGKGRTWTWTPLHGKFAIWKSRSKCIAQGQQANERIRIVLHCGGGQTGNHWAAFFANELCTSAWGNVWTSGGELHSIWNNESARDTSVQLWFGLPAFRLRSQIHTFNNCTFCNCTQNTTTTDVGFFQVCSRTNGCKMQDICSESVRRNGHSDISTFSCFAALLQNLEYGTMPKQQPQLCAAVAATVLCLARHSAFT